MLENAFLFGTRRNAFYNHTSAMLAGARGAKSFESCYCMHEVCHASSGSLCTVKWHGGLC
jgi:hypothetical protein